MMQDWIASLGSGMETETPLERIFIIDVMKFKRAALPVANQVTDASVISKDCRGV